MRIPESTLSTALFLTGIFIANYFVPKTLPLPAAASCNLPMALEN